MPGHVHAFFDEQTATFSYVVHGSEAPQCAIIDPVLNYDPRSGRISTRSADEIIARVIAEELQVQWLLETHVHADHLSAACYIKDKLGGQLAIGRHVLAVQDHFKDVYNLDHDFVPDGSHFDRLLEDGDTFSVGSLSVTAHHVPGHTPADMAYEIEGLGVFLGDTLFMPDVGTARCDFPGGDASTLYRSIQRLLNMDEDVRLYLCHDYPPKTRNREHCTTVKAQREGNIHARSGISEEDFVKMRRARDLTLDMPVLILPAIQVNIRAGRLPEPEDNAVRYLKIPLNRI